MTKKHYKYLIIGAGPAGLQLSYFLLKHTDDLLILEANKEAGSFFSKLPVNRKLISINKVHNLADPGTDLNEYSLRHDWNSLLSEKDDLKFPKYTQDYFPAADDYVKYLNEYANKTGIAEHISYETNVHKISRLENSNYCVGCLSKKKNLTLSCEYLIICTGFSKPHIPKIAGIEHAIGYETLKLDNFEKFRGKRVCLIGKGNSALETAERLTPYTGYMALVSRSTPKFAWNSHYVGDIRAVNNNFFDNYQLKSSVFSMETDTFQIVPKRNITGSGTEYRVSCFGDYCFDYVIRCTGFEHNFDLYDSGCRPNVSPKCVKFPEITWEFESTNNPKMYFYGTLSQSLDYKSGTLGFIHGFRYAGQFLANILRMKELSSTNSLRLLEPVSVQKDLKALTEFICKEISTNSCIWQGFKYWCVVVVFESDVLRVFRNLPVDWVLKHNFFTNHDILMITHEYGFESDDNVFERFPTFQDFNGYLSKFIHPILRFYPKGITVNSQTYDLVQCICGQWGELELMKKTTMCQKCLESLICPTCYSRFPISKDLPEHKCSRQSPTDLFDLMRIDASGVNTNSATQVSKMPIFLRESDPLSTRGGIQTLHVMEDLLGRYYAKETINYKRGCHLPIFRFLSALMKPDQSIDLIPYFYSKNIKPKNQNHIYGFQFYFLDRSMFYVDYDNKQIILVIVQNSVNILNNIPKKQRNLQVLVSHLKEKTGFNTFYTQALNDNSQTSS